MFPLQFRQWIEELFTNGVTACEGAELLIEAPSAMIGIHIAESMKIPYFRAFAMPWSETSRYPHPFAVPVWNLGAVYNRMTYRGFNYLVWRGIKSKVNRWRKQSLNLKPISFGKVHSPEIPFLYNFSEHVAPRPDDWAERTHITGYWFKDQQKASDLEQIEQTISPGLRSFLQEARNKKKKVIYIGFGSVIFPNPQEILSQIEEAVGSADVWAIVSQGWSHLQAPGKGTEMNSLPPGDPPASTRIHYVGAVPHEWLFSKVDATLTHGGAGTTAASLRAGIPTMIKPFFGDQFFWAQIVQKEGYGIHVKGFKVAELTRAFKTATTNGKLIDQAAKIGKALQKENGVATAIQKIYDDMEAARALMQTGLEDKNRRFQTSPWSGHARDPHQPWFVGSLKEIRHSVQSWWAALVMLRAAQYSSIQPNPAQPTHFTPTIPRDDQNHTILSRINLDLRTRRPL